MDLIIGGLVLFGVWCLCKYPDWIFNNRTSPEGYSTDWSAMNKDLASGKSKRDVKIKFNKGGYDIPNKKN